MKITTKQLNEIRIFEKYICKNFNIDENTTEIEARLLLQKLRKEKEHYYKMDIFKENLKKRNNNSQKEYVKKEEDYNSKPSDAHTKNKYTPQEIEEFPDY